MIILTCDKISKSFGIDKVLDQVSFSVYKGTCTGIVGGNGAGKTTLFKIIAGLLEQDQGQIHKGADINIGYLAQNDSIDSNNSIWEELLVVFKPLIAMEERLRDLELEISKHTDTNTDEYRCLAEKYSSLMDDFQKKDGYGYESQMRGVLIGLGFTPDEFYQPIWQLSGGQKTRLALAKLLLSKPDLLLLDEPTNHLDLDAIKWLEGFLKAYEGTIILISHDRYFLDSLCSSIIEIENNKATVFTGNYTDYQKRKRLESESQAKKCELQQKEIARQEAIIKRYRQYNREKSIRAAESRQKALDKMTLIEKPSYSQDIRLSFKCKSQSGIDVLKVKGLSMGFDDKTLFRDISFQIQKGDRVGIIGGNGTGKTTLFKLLLGQLKALDGTIEYGTGLDIGYYEQEQKDLNMANSLLDEISNSFPYLTMTQIRSTLALFLFKGDDVFKRVADLSGGERGRLILAKLMLAQNNFLLLDEPTNHLDMASKEVLENALEDYDGSILVVSHDRYFLNKIVNRILVLENETIKEYLGNYDDYIEKEKLLRLQDQEKNLTKEQLTKTAIREERRKKQEAIRRKRDHARLLEETEKEIKGLEDELKELEIKLSDPKLYEDREVMLKTQQQYSKVKSTLDERYEKWLEMQEGQD